MKKAQGLESVCSSTITKLSFSLGQYITAFHIELYANKEYAVDNLQRSYRNRNPYLLSEKLSCDYRTWHIPDKL
jgi:hypothetical protein